jgi:hypothetical protein
MRKPKKKKDHKLIRWLIEKFAPGHGLHKNPCKRKGI